MPQLPALAAAVTLTTSAISTAMAVAINPKTRVLRLRCSGTPPVAFRVAESIGGDPVAVVTDVSMADNEVVYFGLDPARANTQQLKVAAIDR